jgi:RraA family protein
VSTQHPLISTLVPGRTAWWPGLARPLAEPAALAEPDLGPARGRPLRVLLISEACGGGAGRHVLDLAEGLIGRGCDVQLIGSPHRCDSFFRERLGRAVALRHALCPMRRSIHPRDLAAVRWVRRYVRDFGPFDVLHGHSAKGGAVARLAALGTRTPVLYTPHGFVLMDPGVPPGKRLLYHAVEWVLSRVTDRIIAVSPEERRFVIARGLGESRVVVIPNGIAPIDFPPRASARRELGLRDDALVVGFVGRLVDQKAPDVLIEAFAAASHSVPACRLVMVGTGPLEGPLRRLADGLGLNDRVLWLGERDGPSVLPALDLFALPSHKEGLPYVMLEALAAGLPIVATTSAGVELLVRHGENGWVVPAGQPEPFARALAELLSDPRKLARFGRASLEIRARFTTEAMVDQTLAVYRHCLRIPVGGGAVPRSGRVVGRGTEPPPTEIPAARAFNTNDQGAPSMASKPRSAEMHPGPGFRVRTDCPRPDPGLAREFVNHATPDISDLLNRLYAVDPAVRCLTGDHHVLCGPACTVKVFPGDNLMVHKALDVAKPGDVVVVDAGGSTSNAVLGDLISAKARHRRIAGFVVDGLIRDLPSIVPLDFPVFARGTTPIGPLHRGPGEINYPICCGGVVVNPGDLVIADAAGVIIVPREIAPELLERLRLHDETNRAYLESVRRGDFSNRWVDQLLEEHHCPVVSSSSHGERGWNGNSAPGDGRPSNGTADHVAGGALHAAVAAKDLV